jgi:hypothetical protein
VYHLSAPPTKVISDKGSRYYQFAGATQKYPSVTTIIKKYQKNIGLEKWKERVGEKEAEQVSKTAREIGTNVHSANEIYFTRHKSLNDLKLSEEEFGRHYAFLPFLSAFHPVRIECPFSWEEAYPDNPRYIYGYGGTPDVVGSIATGQVFYSDKACETPYEPLMKSSLFIADYKNWKRPNYATNLIHTYLQVAAYIAMVNKYLPGHLTIKDGFVAGTAPCKTNGPYQLMLYHLDWEKLNWYWSWFKQILYDYYRVPVDFKFNWYTFENYSKGVERVYDEETETWSSKKLDKNYLATRIFLPSLTLPVEKTASGELG